MIIIEKLKLIEFLGNTAYDYVLAAVIFVGVLLILKIFQVVILSRLKSLAKKTATDFDDILIGVFTKIKPPFYFFIALYFGLKVINISSGAGVVIRALVIIAIVYEVIRAIERLIGYLLKKHFNKDKDNSDKAHTEATVKTFQMFIGIVLWVIGLLLILSNLGININSLVASLGIGGIAIALALQNILGDLFSSFSLYMDKPFQAGDFITLGKDSGIVQKIGLKTTRLKTLQGEELIISNKELTGSRIQNFKRMEKRRVVFSLGLKYETKAEKLEKVPEIITEIISGVEGARFDRCHFVDYGDFSLNFETVFYVDSSDYVKYLDTKQKINFEIFKRFAKEKISFAYPTQSIFLEK